MRAVVVAMLFVLVSCGGGEATPDAFVSTCGEPGDQGNELGIGKFCASQVDCSQLPGAPLCSSLGDDTTHFCTRTCTMGDSSVCGTDAMCTCNDQNQCGCTPTKCLGP